MQSRQSLELRQRQQLALTPQLQQSIRFLQLSTHELEQEIAQALLDNPLLERDPEYDTDAGVAEAVESPIVRDEWMATGSAKGATSSEDDIVRPETALDETLEEHLLRQLHTTRASARDCALVSLLIAELDDSGYMATPLEEIINCLPPSVGVNAAELHAALRLLQSFDPAGVGATSLADCLLLQLGRLSETSADLRPSTEVLACASAIAASHLDLLASGKLNRLRETLMCSTDTLQAAHTLLLRLNPRPAGQWTAVAADYVIPEILVRKVGGKWLASVNPSVLPRLRVNTAYESLLANLPAAPAMQGQLQQAHGLIRNVHQRFLTLARVAQAIVDRQSAFFEQGAMAMRPLLLRDIAFELEMHESTVSRATRLKYAQTPWGVIELKQLFGAALPSEGGNTTSATAVQSQIRALIAQEPAGKPLSDSKIVQCLEQQGVVIARRTVAKYREAAGIEPAIQRRVRAAAQRD